MAQISTVMIPCWCVQKNNQMFISPEGIVGAIENIPCREVNVDEILYWCTPVTDYGIGDAIEFRLVDSVNPIGTPPTVDSFLVQRIRDKVGLNKNNTWWVYVLTANDFLNSCATCCGVAAVPMPAFTFMPFVPCTNICPDNNGDLVSYFGLPTLGTDQVYFPTGIYDNIALPAADAGGYANISDLLTFLSSNWGTVGSASPPAALTWAVSSDLLTLEAIGGEEGHSLCVTVQAVIPVT